MDWYPWHYRRYREKTLHLTAEQDGIYRRLIDYYMETRKPLPDNDLALARIAGVDLVCFKQASSTIKAFFKQEESGVLSHKTCNDMLDDQDKLVKFHSERAKKGAAARHKKSNEINENPASSKQEAPLQLATITVDNNNISSLEDISPLPPKGKSQKQKSDYSETFIQAWPLYPSLRKGEKADAWKAWQGAIKRGYTEQQIFEGVKKYAASDEASGSYAKGYPAWLNGNRFTWEYKPMGVQGSRPARGNRGFDSLATAAAKISKNNDREAERMRRDNPVLYYQRLATQSGGGNDIAGSFDASDTGEPDAAPLGIGYSQES